MQHMSSACDSSHVKVCARENWHPPYQLLQEWDSDVSCYQVFVKTLDKTMGEKKTTEKKSINWGTSEQLEDFNLAGDVYVLCRTVVNMEKKRGTCKAT